MKTTMMMMIIIIAIDNLSNGGEKGAELSLIGTGCSQPGSLIPKRTMLKGKVRTLFIPGLSGKLNNGLC